MITIKPFRAWRPVDKYFNDFHCVPYDVINTEEARTLFEGKPNSFLRVIRPEVDLPSSIDDHADEVYETGAKNLNTFCDEGILTQETNPSLYVYRLNWRGRSQTGIFACVSVNDYDNDRILKHELTRPDKEDDRTRHIIEQQAHAEPVMLTYRGNEKINKLVRDAMLAKPLYDFEAEDGVKHTVWKAANSAEISIAFKEVEKLYVADGHHRCKSASRAAEEMKKRNPASTGEESWNFFPAVVIPMEQMEILPYNRVVHSAEDETLDSLVHDLRLTPTPNPVPNHKGQVCAFLKGRWYNFELPLPKKPSPVDLLDAARLQSFILGPFFGIQDPRLDKKVSFVGGIRGTIELEKLVNSRKASVAFSMHPTSIEELIHVSDALMLMPPKSTWFEPKLRSGLLIHRF